MEDAPLVVDEADVEDEEIIAVVIVVVPLPLLPLVPVSLFTACDDLPPTADDPSDTLSNLIAPGTPLVELVDSLRTDSSLLDDRILSRSSPLERELLVVNINPAIKFFLLHYSLDPQRDVFVRH